ncbi:MULTISPECIES: eicosapentaenoate synthase subunit PfaD [unclassified Shewanella]|uniref:eicosapentaenoate synthase subunit PfaD n=1 Tax=unclassified Shewanella TaxID=196818 RepID=UPI000C85C549|nr:MULTISPECIES: eicosapentaenoate synthase subunit PfaD [unclassified Shewanella]MDO6678390.1 eicosapentaenoate synthase subunit PfaD [Shewanella sp. 4_MG-2023]MDO6776280.1 eicosapentaenoate synthase subunit PfaD [Shewanella sp. 3_MG-2023]PMG42191.1 2-nitropropane dioxygenase [Shewanella sp. 10N.286.52.B9]PMH87580.1 2-nitropropane dioxygenase [Shewanella sp. 10N.286.48.B5]
MTISTQNEKLSPWPWQVAPSDASFDPAAIGNKLKELSQACYLVSHPEKGLGVSQKAQVVTESISSGQDLPVSAFAPALGTQSLGDSNFRRVHGVKYAYYAGAMANGISSEELVIALGQAGILCSFGAAGLIPSRVEQAINRIQAALPNGPYMFNLIHSPSEPALERGSVELFLKHKVRTVEASAFLGLTPQIVYYRAAGLSRDASGNVVVANKVIAKVSRTEVAIKFMQPAPVKILQKLVDEGLITPEQMELAQLVPMADDITAEADSGGHTDNRPLVTLLPTILALKDKVQAEYNYNPPIRVGCGGGVGTPDAALATFNMGAAYIVTGSINQACVEAGASEHTRKLLATTEMADVTMAPAADMFEMGVKLQVVKRGTLFPMRANKLYEIYSRYESIEAIPAEEREKLEKQVFRSSLDEIWAGTVAHFNERDPKQIERAQGNPKRKMALIFRWYLGLSSRWSNSGEVGREMDYQIWAGPALGAFNEWAKGSYLDDYTQRNAVDLAKHLMHGAAYQARINLLTAQGVAIPVALQRWSPLDQVK